MRIKKNKPGKLSIWYGGDCLFSDYQLFPFTKQKDVNDYVQNKVHTELSTLIGKYITVYFDQNFDDDYATAFIVN